MNLEHKQLLELIAQEKTNVEISQTLGVTFDSVKYKLKKYGIRRPLKEFDFICTRCRAKKTKSEFYLRNTKRYHTECKNCFNRAVLERQRVIKQQAVNYKGGKCLKCGYNKCIGALQFHHLQEKHENWKTFKLRRFDDRFKEELDKCILLCANCHAEEHTNYC